MVWILNNINNMKVFKTDLKREREKKDLDIYNEYEELMSVKGQSKTMVNEYLMKKYNIHSVGTIYTIRKRTAERLEKEKEEDV